MIGLQINGRELLSMQSFLLRAADPVTLLTVGGRSMANAIRGNFDRLEQERPNKQGWPRQHLWSQMRRSVQNPQVSADSVTVSINHVAAAQRYFGGDIVPTGGKKFLTIPARAEAYGHRARDFSNLRFGFAANAEGRAQPALIQADATVIRFGRKKKDGTRNVSGERVGGEPFFWLVRRVHQDKDPTVLPTEDELQTAVQGAITNYVARQTERSGGAA